MKKAVLLLLVLVSCTGGGTPRPTATPSGPPTIQPEVVERHAEQFEEDLPERRAGSQEEFAAATYITAHLQQAGYVVEFDSVPVANTVRSTNVVALPPSTQDPEYLVTVAYDDAGEPEAIAAFLELARALRAAVPGHSVEFAALGAESEKRSGGALGSRRMVQLLQERDLDPRVVQIVGTTPETWAIEGELESDACRGSKKVGCISTGLAVRSDVFEEAGFERTLVAAPAKEMAAFLFEFLSG